jgi:hypothetical protein
MYWKSFIKNILYIKIYILVIIMKKIEFINKLLVIFLFITLLLSFCILCHNLFKKNVDNVENGHNVNAWRFPMILAVFLDTIINYRII